MDEYKQEIDAKALKQEHYITSIHNKRPKTLLSPLQNKTPLFQQTNNSTYCLLNKKTMMTHDPAKIVAFSLFLFSL
ncbi:hypothetical protein LguiB_033532 [Lonicera macranthoides]